jgi:hypothetical protein
MINGVAVSRPVKEESMKLCWFTRLAPVPFLMLALATGCSGIRSQAPQAGADGGAPPFSRAQAIEVPKGTAVYIRLQEAISSATAQEGQNFSAILDEPVVAEGQVIAPQGTLVTGRVVAARQSGHMHDAGYLRLTLSSITLNGKAVPVQTSSLFVKGGSFRNRNLAYVGGGAGGSSLLGGLAVGGKGTLIGGATADHGAAYAANSKEVGFAAEHRLGFRLIEAMKVE